MTNWMLQEEMDAEFNARYDDVRERFAATLADIEAWTRGEEEAEAAEVEAWLATPEGQAWTAEQARKEEARKAAAEEDRRLAEAFWAGDTDNGYIPF